MVTRILLIRHASTDSRGRLCGSFDVPLSLAGYEDVQALMRRFASRAAPDALYTSTLRRASDVAAALGQMWALQPQDAEWAREIHCGDVEGMPLIEVQRQFPELWARNDAQEDDAFAWPGGETYADFRTRIMRGLEDTAARHSGKRVALVTHAGVVSQVLGVIHKRPASVWALDRPHPLTATEITWQNGAPCAVLIHNNPDWY